MQNANFPTDGEGRTYHLFLKKGEVANRIITAGDLWRIYAFAQLPGFEIKFVRQAPRLFTTFTGLYKGTPVTLITSLMGIPNMDFLVRELRYCVDGPFAIVRIGSCGTPMDTAAIGDITIPDAYTTVLRIPDGYAPGTEYTPDQCFSISKPILPDAALKACVLRKAVAAGLTCHGGTSVSACSFYSSQGRRDESFNDRNTGLLDLYDRTFSDFCSMEMESAHLCDLARCVNTNKAGAIYGCAAHIILAQRRSNEFLSDEKKHAIEKVIGIAVLEALLEFAIPGTTAGGSTPEVCTQTGPITGDWDWVREHMKRAL